jgi:hypothetical protein
LFILYNKSIDKIKEIKELSLNLENSGVVFYPKLLHKYYIKAKKFLQDEDVDTSLMYLRRIFEFLLVDKINNHELSEFDKSIQNVLLQQKEVKKTYDLLIEFKQIFDESFLEVNEKLIKNINLYFESFDAIIELLYVIPYYIQEASLKFGELNKKITANDGNYTNAVDKNVLSENLIDKKEIKNDYNSQLLEENVFVQNVKKNILKEDKKESLSLLDDVDGEIPF